jgi:hypothetical protein
MDPIASKETDNKDMDRKYENILDLNRKDVLLQSEKKQGIQWQKRVKTREYR